MKNKFDVDYNLVVLPRLRGFESSFPLSSKIFFHDLTHHVLVYEDRRLLISLSQIECRGKSVSFRFHVRCVVPRWDWYSSKYFCQIVSRAVSSVAC